MEMISEGYAAALARVSELERQVAQARGQIGHLEAQLARERVEARTSTDAARAAGDVIASLKAAADQTEQAREAERSRWTFERQQLEARVSEREREIVGLEKRVKELLAGNGVVARVAGVVRKARGGAR